MLVANGTGCVPEFAILFFILSQGDPSPGSIGFQESRAQGVL